MAIKRPYSAVEHRTFKRTFLQQTEVTVKFTPAINDVDFRDRMIPYLKSTFNLDLSDKVDVAANHAEVDSDVEQKKFVFDLDQAKFLIGPSSYRTFAETAIPMVAMLIRFLNDVAKVESTEQLKIAKINLWPIKTEDAFSNFGKMIRYTFKEDCVSDMLSYKFGDNPTPVRLSKNSDSVVSENVELKATLSAEVVSKEKVNLGLVLNAKAYNVSANELLSDSIILNDHST